MTVIMLVALFVLDIISSNNEAVKNALSLTLGNTGINVVYLGVCIFFIIAAASDALDGYLARKNNQVTDLGKVLDPVADKLLVNGTIIYLLVNHPYTSTNMVWPLYTAIIIIIRDIVVDALRFIAASKNEVIAANIFGKVKTVLEMVAIPLVLLNGFPFRYFDASWGALTVTNIIIYITTIASLASGIIYVIQNRHVLAEDKAKAVIEKLAKEGLTLGSCESITGGAFASAITKVPGASKVYKGSVISYSNEVKINTVGVRRDIIEDDGVVSFNTAIDMAVEARKLLNVDICVSCTGNAGPDVCDDKPVGRVYIAIATEGKVYTRELNLKGDRNKIQAETVKRMIKLIVD